MALLIGQVVTAAPGLHGFDASVSLKAATAAVFKQMGFAFCIRYVGRKVPQSLSDLTTLEAKVILAAGLALMPVQHVAAEGWDDLFWRRKTKHYWKSGRTVPDIPQRGYQPIQQIIKNDEIAGVEIDRDLTRTDGFGDAVIWLAP